MDLLACSECERRFYAPAAEPSGGRRCPRCKGGLVIAMPHVTSIPLDARGLNHGPEPPKIDPGPASEARPSGEQRTGEWGT
jgi:hypothetical protein